MATPSDSTGSATPAGAPTPEEIRSLRGNRTRPEFAAEVGVSPLSIYRWELPRDNPESRRPRRRHWDAIRRAGGPGATPAPPRPVMPAEAGTVDRSAAPAPQAPADAPSPLPEAEADELLPLLHLLFNAQWDEAESRTLRLAGTGQIGSPAGRALLQVASATFRLFGRNDPTGAAMSLLPVLAEAERDHLPPLVAVRAFTVGAWLFATPHGDLFNPGRVNTCAGRLDVLAAPEDAHLRHVGWTARLHAALSVGDRAVIEGELARARDGGDAADARGTLSTCLLAEAHALAALAQTRYADAVERLQATIALADAHAVAVVAHRARARLALIELDRQSKGEPVLDLVAAARNAASEAHLEPDLASALLDRAEAEALVTADRNAEALACVERADGIVRRIKWPPVDLAPVWVTLRVAGPIPSLEARIGWLHRAAGGPLDARVRATVAVLESFHHYGAGDMAASREAAARGVALARDLGDDGWLEGAALVRLCLLQLAAGEGDAARTTLDRVRHNLRRHPSLVRAASVRSCEILEAALDGRGTDVLRHAQAGLAAMETSGNPTLTLRWQHFAACGRFLLGEPDAESELDMLEAQMRERGLAPPKLVSRDRLLAARARRDDRPAVPLPDRPASALLAMLDRLTLATGGGQGVAGELVAVLDELFGEAGSTLDHLDDTGDIHRLHGGSANPIASAEFEGAGQRFRVGVLLPLDGEAQAALQLLARMAGLLLDQAGAGRTPMTIPVAGTRPESDLEGVVAGSRSMREMIARARRLARSRACVLIHGESGTGKEVVAHAIHRLSARASQPMVTFNCAAVPAELFEGQLFGYRRGAFTGATIDRPGVIRAADGGTLFLDEIGDLPPGLQPKLLRFIENGEVFPLGETQPVIVDVRIIAATHHDLPAMVRDGRFREDLFYRLQVVPLTIPPLRERRDDVVLLANHFIEKQTPTGETAPLLGPDAVTALVEHPWPGNVRELRNVIERALAWDPRPAVLGASHLQLQ